MTLKGSSVESFSCIIKVSEPVIIQPVDGPIKGQTHKNHSLTRRIKSTEPPKRIVLKQETSQPLFVQSEFPSKVTMKNALNLNPPGKLYECTSCTDNATPWMVNNENKVK